MAEGDTPGLQWERTRLAWLRTTAAAASLDVALAAAVVHVGSLAVLAFALPSLTVASALLLSVHRDLRQTHTPWHPTAWRTFESLSITFVIMATLGVAIALH